MHEAPRKAIVLIVEDEPLLLLQAIDTVLDAGLEPITATNADEAVVLLEADLDIRIVFTDIDLPGSMDGIKLAEAIRDRWPPIEIILTSGHMRPEIADLPARSRFFAKPYNPEAIGRVLRAMTA